MESEHCVLFTESGILGECKQFAWASAVFCHQDKVCMEVEEQLPGGGVAATVCRTKEILRVLLSLLAGYICRTPCHPQDHVGPTQDVGLELSAVGP